MIWESHFWKKDLLYTAGYLRRLDLEDLRDEESLVRIEKAVMGAAYAIRKLREAKKLSQSVLELGIHAEKFPSREKHVDYMNWHKVEELYDFEKGQSHTLSFSQFCNQIIHSWVFIPEESENHGLEGILVSSDRFRNECLFRIPREQMLKIIEQVGSDYPNAANYVRDAETGEIQVTNFCRDESEGGFGG